MIKIMYCLYHAPKAEGDTLNNILLNTLLLNDLSHELLVMDFIHGLQINVIDKDVKAAEGKRIENTSPLPIAIISVWLDAHLQHAQIIDKLKKHLGNDLIASYHVVAESAVIKAPETVKKQRSPGFSQIAFLSIPNDMPAHKWFDHWLNIHTHIAIETQSTFRYLQNKIVFSQPIGAAHSHNINVTWSAIVEESFPAAAMENLHVFFNAANNDDLLQQNILKMMESCQQFINYETLNVLVSSEYIYK